MPPKPTLDLLRALTDEHVLRSVMRHGRLTRVQIAADTGLSKPTVYDSVSRLTTAGVLVDTGERTTGRGRIGSYYSLAGDSGTALVVAISASGVHAEAIDAFGRPVATAHAELDRSAGPIRASRALAQAAGQIKTPGALRCATVSAADPVDRDTGRLVRLPDSPFLVGDLDPVATLAPFVAGPILVDNDVNWAARAEHAALPPGIDDFVYLYLGEGLGCAVVSDGHVHRGGHGLAGEISHLYTPGPDGAALAFTDVFAALELRRPASAAIDVEALRHATSGAGPTAVRIRAIVARAVCGVILGAITLVDPQMAVIGGPWGADTTMIAAIEEQLGHAPRTVPIAAAQVDAPELAGARSHALEALRNAIINRVSADQ